MDGDYGIRIEAIAAEALVERAAASGRSLEDEIASARASAVRLTVEEKLELSRRLRAMTPSDCLSHDSTDVIRWFRDTHGGRWTDDGWTDDDRR